MRYQGRIAEWKDDRGFGFIAPNGDGPKVFVHISSFSNRTRRPRVGVLVTYELGADQTGRLRAQDARFVGDSRGRSAEPNPIVAAIGMSLVVVFLCYVGYVRISHPGSTVAASLYKIFFAREALQDHPQFQCMKEKSFCSQMSSCAEAFFHEEKCGVSTMDGDRDGIPCEQQWCY
jgi:cold shock CspA family protein